MKNKTLKKIWEKAIIPVTAFSISTFLVVTASNAEEIITSHGISTFGDLNLAADFKHLPYVNPDAPVGGEISEWTFGGFDSMNPYSIKGRAAALSSAPYESILTSTADEIGASYCLLCETIQYPEDRSWVIFNLRPEVRFSDGSPMTAEDVKFSFETFLSKGLTDFRTVLANQVENVEILGPHKVKFTFKEGVSHRDLPASMGELPIISKAHYEQNGLDLEESSLIPFLGTGEYLLDSYDIGKSVKYRRNPNYWGKDIPINIGRGNFDTIRIEYFGDYDAAFEAFKGGSYTFRNEASSLTWNQKYDFPAANDGTIVKVALPSGEKASGQAFLFNLRRAKFQDPRVREAIGLMFNFEWANATLFGGLYARINSIWENTWLAAQEKPSPEEIAILKPLVEEGLIPQEILIEPAIMAPISGERQLDRKNLRKASKLLDEAGWSVGKDGIRRNAEGEKLSIEFLNDSPSFDRLINPYVESLKALGIDAYLTRIDSAQMETRTRPPSYDFDIITGNARADYTPGSELLQFYGSQTADVSTFNLSGLKSPAVDRLIEVVMAAKTKEELTVATRALDRVLRAERFWVPQWYKNKHTVAYYDIFEHPKTLPPYDLGELDFWWYNAEKAKELKEKGLLKQ